MGVLADRAGVAAGRRIRREKSGMSNAVKVGIQIGPLDDMRYSPDIVYPWHFRLWYPGTWEIKAAIRDDKTFQTYKRIGNTDYVRQVS